MSCRKLLLLLILPGLAAAAPNGEQVYQKKCASCHGQNGEGTKRYKKPLAGENSAAQLTDLIAKTMPEDKPGSCVGPEAEAVAKYIHDAFYSAAARERTRPPRVELARLTVKQYRNAVADVIGSFRQEPSLADAPGLSAEYYASRGYNGNKRQVRRVDAEVDFDFGTGTPNPGKYEPHEFSILWDGAVQPPETGLYEFVVRTEQSAKLYVNDRKTALVDAWVKSGDDTEFRGSIFLVAGRPYPLKLEFSKSQQGVNNQDRAKKRASFPASIRLMWKVPGRSLEVVPGRYLANGFCPVAFVPTVPFPPDDRSMGWERGTTISKAWDQATTDGALEAATYVAANLNELAGSKEGANDRAAKVKGFGRSLVERAFRRPLSSDEQRLFVDRFLEPTADLEAGIKKVVLLAFKSPRFLYRESSTASDPYSIASRLSFALWDSVPDAELIQAAAKGKLSTRHEIVVQAERMLKDPRAKVKLREFLHAWLKVDHARDLAKDAKRFPGFDPAVVTDLQASLDLFLDDVVWSKGSDFRRLLLDDTVYMNRRLAQYYGLPWAAPIEPARQALAFLQPAALSLIPEDRDFRPMKLEAGERAGVLTHPYLLAAFAYSGTTSPIHRGVFLSRGVLGIALKTPPDAFTPFAEELHPTLTTRERVMLQTKPASCQTCHGTINPLGFALEKFDAVGRFRDKENGKPIDASGTYQLRSGESVTFHGARDLAAFLANSDEVHAAFAQQLFQHLVKQPVRAYGPARLDDLRKTFAASGFSVRTLAAEIAVAATLPATGK